MPARHCQAATPLPALRNRAARLWARHESLGCLLFAVAATLATSTNRERSDWRT